MANNIPSVTSPLPRDLQQFVRRVREALDGGGLDAVVTARQLVAAGIAQTSGGSISSTGGTVDAPRAPTNLQTSGALATIVVSWEGPAYKGHAYTEIWSAPPGANNAVPVLGDAELIGMTAGNNFSHSVGGGATKYYWVRNVNQNGVASAFNATDGVVGQTAVDPDYLLTVLTGAITESQLYSDLSTRIDLIDAADTVTGSVAQRIKAEHDSRVSAQATISSAVSAEQTARQDADSATTSRLDVAVSQYQHNAASIASEAVTRADATSAVAARTDVLGASVGDAFAGIQAEEEVRANADESSAIRIDTLVSQVGTNTAGIQTESNTRATQDSALASQVNIVSSTAGDNAAAIQTESNTRATQDSAVAAQINTVSSSVSDSFAAIQTESNTRASGDTASANSITTLQSTVSGHTTSISTNASSINGLEAQYTVKIDNNGHVAGFGLASELVDGDFVSDFMVAADRFSVVNPSVPNDTITRIRTAPSSTIRIDVDTSGYTHISGDTITISGMGQYNGTYTTIGAGSGYVLVASSSGLPVYDQSGGEDLFQAAYPAAKGALNLTQETPFIIATGSSQINGVTVPAGTYINSAMIADATIKNAQINDLTADKITASLLNTVDFYGNTIAGSTMYLGGTVTYTQDTDGNNIGIQSVTTPAATLSSTGINIAVSSFVVNDGSTDYTPFQVVDSVAYLNNAMIKDSTLSFAKVADDIQSTNYIASGGTQTPAGWKLTKGGTIDFTGGTITAGTLQSTDGNFVIDLTNKTITIET